MAKMISPVAGILIVCALGGCRAQECAEYRQVAQELVYTRQWSQAWIAGTVTAEQACRVLGPRQPYFEKAGLFFKAHVFDAFTETRCATLPLNDSMTHWGRECGLWPKEGYADVYYAMEDLKGFLPDVAKFIGNACPAGDVGWAPNILQYTNEVWSKGYEFYQHECKTDLPFPGAEIMLPPCNGYRPGVPGDACRTPQGYTLRWLGEGMDLHASPNVSANTWRDDQTGFVLTDPLLSGVTYAQAQAFCRGLNVNHFQGFDLPSLSLMSDLKARGAIQVLTSTGAGAGTPHHDFESYWTSTPGSFASSHYVFVPGYAPSEVPDEPAEGAAVICAVAPR